MLEGKTAIVTGGGGGIGRAISERFAVHGARVVLGEIDPDRAEQTEAALRAAGHDATALVVDIRRADDVRRLVAEAGPVDVLVNNVGHFVFPGRRFWETTEDEWDEIYRVNVEHVLRCTHAVLPGMIERGRGGSIINLTTVEAFRGIPQHPVYAAGKAAVTQFGRSLAVDVGEFGIRVNAIAPDVTRSEQLPYDRWLTDDDRARIPRWVPIGRLGEPDDIAGVALFLASDQSAFVTGTTIHADGGTHAAGGWYRTARPDRPWTNRPLDP
jgi:NAD(P)-dependent dehydrogenase (short-subunit alcohol dehydrogenase family)